MEAIEIVHNIQELPPINQMTRQDKWAARVLTSLAHSSFRYGGLTIKQKELLFKIRTEHNLTGEECYATENI